MFGSYDLVIVKHQLKIIKQLLFLEYVTNTKNYNKGN